MKGNLEALGLDGGSVLEGVENHDGALALMDVLTNDGDLSGELLT